MSNIIPAPQTSKQVEVSENKGRQYLRESMKMVSQGIALGFRGKLMIAAGLWNIRELKLHYLQDKGLTQDEFIEKSGVKRSSYFAYLQVGDRLNAARKKESRTSAPIISQNDIKEIFEVSTANNQEFTLRGLFKAAQSQEQFDRYLATGKNEEVIASAANLLKPRKLTEAEIEKLDADGRAAVAADNRHTGWGNAYAREHGFHYDRDSGKWLNEDGSPISEKQYAEMTKYSDAIRVFEEAEAIISKAAAELYKCIHTEGTAYRRFKTGHTNKKFSDEAFQSKTTAARRLQCMDEMLVHLLEGDITDAENIYKKSI
ncbi:MAG: hypothetical protein ABI778_04375 [Ignavibacteriota bacterium]